MDVVLAAFNSSTNWMESFKKCTHQKESRKNSRIEFRVFGMRQILLAHLLLQLKSNFLTQFSLKSLYFFSGKSQSVVWADLN